MKKLNTFLKIIGLVLLTSIMFIGCFDEPPVFDSGNIKPGMGAIQLKIEGDERTLFPVFSDVSYAISGTSGSNTVSSTATTFDLAPGTWDITIDAKKGEKIIGKATVTGVVIELGKTTRVDVILAPFGTGTGTLSWTITAPAGLDTEILEYSANNGTTWTPLTPFAAGTQTLAAGSYLARSALTGSGGSDGDIEAFHIYEDHTTLLNWSYSADGLIREKAFAGSVSITTGALTSVTSVQWELTGDGGMSPRTITLEGTGPYTFNINIPESVNNVGGKLLIAVTNSAAALERTLENQAYAANLTLPALNVYTISAVVGENGALTVNGTALANSARRDFIGGTAITLVAQAIPAFELDRMFVNTAPQVSGYQFNIAADTVVDVLFKEQSGDGPVVIWEWKYADGLTGNGNSATNFLGSAPGMVFRSNGNVNTGATVGINLVNRIGIGSNLSTSSNNNDGHPSRTVYDPDGKFDFWGDDGSKKVKVTAVFECTLTNGTDARNVILLLNSNQSASAVSAPLSVHGTDAVIASLFTTDAAIPLGEFTLEGTIDPAAIGFHNDFINLPANAGKSLAELREMTMKTALIGVVYPGSGTTTAVQLKSIVVEFVGGQAPLDPNLIWEWVYDTTNGPGTLAVANQSHLVGRGSHAQAANMPIRIQHANVSYAAGQGIILDGSINTSGCVLIIGSTVRAAGGTQGVDSFPSSGTFAPDGVFDFRTGNTNGIRISLGMEILADGVNNGANRGFNVIINNNTTTAGSTPLSDGSNQGRIALWNVPVAAGTGLGAGATYNTTTKTLTCATFTPATFLQTNIATLEKAFVGISTLGQSGTAPNLNLGAKILLTSIKIEYVPAP